ncbi:hypothetical protein JCM6882_003845 [Rhodosporidiobolus microsporus]
MAQDSEAYDFAAHTRLDLDAPAEAKPQKKAAPSLGPSFAIPSKLEAFVLLAKSARGSGAAALVGQAVAAQGVFVFSELLEQPSIKDLANSEQHQAQYRLLELFAYGTWGDYDTKRDSYPTLTPDQETKLKQLTILTLATQSRSIPYSLLLSTLSLPSIPALEDLLISAFYADVLTGRLDQKAGVLEVTSAHGRDVRPSAPAPTVDAESMELDAPASSSAPTAPSVADLTMSLSTFLQRLTTLISSLDAHLSTLTADALNAVEVQTAHEDRVKAVIEEVSKSDSKTSGGGGGGGSGWKGKVEDAAKNVKSAVSFATGIGGPSSGGSGEGMDLDQPAGGGGAGAGGTTRGAGGSPASGGMGGRTRKRGRNL